jgi:hypothetical protein
MARIYKKEEYGQLFEPAGKSVAYNPVIAFDNSRAIQDEHARKIEDVKTLARGAQRQAELDSQAIQVQKAYSDANYATLKGLLSLSSSAMGLWKHLDESARQVKEENTLLESIGWTEHEVAPTPEEEQQFKANDVAVKAEAQGVTQVSKEIQSEPGYQADPNAQSTSHALQQTTTYQAQTAAQGNVYDAIGSHPIFLAEAMRNLSNKPKTAAEAQVLVRELNRQFLRQTGMMGASREDLLRLARSMQGNTGNAVLQLVNAGIKEDQQASLNEAQSFTSTLVDNNTPVEELWSKVSERYAFGNVGYNGHSAGSNQAALENILSEAVANGNTSLIRELRKVTQVPGQVGTELERKYDHIFDKAERDAVSGAIQNWNLTRAEQDMKMKQSIQFYYDDPSPENRRNAIATLRTIGTEEALKEAERLGANGLAYDPQKKFELLEMRQQGIPIPQDMLETLLRNGTINQDEYKQFATTSVDVATAKKLDSALKEVSSGLKAAMQGKAGPTDLSPEVKAQLATRHPMLMDELRSKVLSHIKSNPSIADNPAELGKVIEAYSQEILKKPEYSIVSDPKKGWYFQGGIINNTSRLVNITVAPGIQDFSKVKPEDAFGKLQYPKSEMDPTKDRFLTPDQLKADVKALMEGGKLSNRARLYARNLGYSDQGFIEAQLEAAHLPSLRSLREGGGGGPVPDEITDKWQGMKALQNMGLPTRGAAYIAGNITTESKWSGQRSWDDVGAKAGGLISWRAERLKALENHFGRPVTQISDREQLQYMMTEMKRRNPEAYRTFMDPNASDSDLQKASYSFWGWGVQGDRFSIAKELLGSGDSYSSRRGNLTGANGYTGSSNVIPVGMRDQQGRDVRFSPRAAGAWRQMIAAGMPVRGQDVTNGYRNAAEYNRLRSSGYGAAANSAHNYGEGVDIHGPMGEWIKKHGQRYGWVLVDYHGSHGGHFEYRGTS